MLKNPFGSIGTMFNSAALRTKNQNRCLVAKRLERHSCLKERASECEREREAGRGGVHVSVLLEWNYISGKESLNISERRGSMT